ncbi:hypothetical protein GWI33_004330 [Rhynchophorus ferrugineus]|uniref:Uncharacterized protein n=1 Tax=Rhynchophorus ferrugineus TaxID=354439 RepID=A0A834ISW4_RHYFE|nr:hypothetical protein GWI33_004330 [Rhynchophorus ferrugineus]
MYIVELSPPLLHLSTSFPLVSVQFFEPNYSSVNIEIPLNQISSGVGGGLVGLTQTNELVLFKHRTREKEKSPNLKVDWAGASGKESLLIEFPSSV